MNGAPHAGGSPGWPGRWQARAIAAVLVAQLLAALADNALLIVAIGLLEARQAPGWLTPALRVGFYASYVLLAPCAGRWADAWPKGRLMALVNAIKVAGVAALAGGAHPLLVFAAIGCGAAAYAPARYGMLPELSAGRALVRANAAMEIVTIIGIIGGYALGSALVGGSGTASACAVLAALYGVAAACTLGRGRVAAAGMAARAAATTATTLTAATTATVTTTVAATAGAAEDAAAGAAGAADHIGFRAGVRILLADTAARRALTLTSIFWATAAVLQFVMLDWARRSLGLSLAQAAVLPAILAAGMVGGAAAAGAWAGLAVKPWLPALCALALGGAVLLMPLVRTAAGAGLLLAATGLLAGALLVPMNARLQERGAALMQPGLSVAVQNFFENGSAIVFLAAYGAALAAGASLDATIDGLGLAVLLLVLILVSLRTWPRRRRRGAAPQSKEHHC